MSIRINQTEPDCEAQTTEGPIRFQSGSGLVGGALLTSQGRHPGLHDGARVNGPHQA